MQIIEDFLKWILKINLIDISIIIFILINAGLIIFFIIKGIKAIKKLYKKDSLKKQKVCQVSEYYKGRKNKKLKKLIPLPLKA